MACAAAGVPAPFCLTKTHALLTVPCPAPLFWECMVLGVHTAGVTGLSPGLWALTWALVRRWASTGTHQWKTP